MAPAARNQLLTNHSCCWLPAARPGSHVGYCWLRWVHFPSHQDLVSVHFPWHHVLVARVHQCSQTRTFTIHLSIFVLTGPQPTICSEISCQPSWLPAARHCLRWVHFPSHQDLVSVHFPWHHVLVARVHFPSGIFFWQGFELPLALPLPQGVPMSLWTGSCWGLFSQCSWTPLGLPSAQAKLPRLQVLPR